jgi:hypothetical protein
MSQSTNLISSDFNLKRLSTNTLSKHLEASIAMGANVFILGRRGIGKTQIAKQEIAKSKNKLVYLNLSVFERTDLGGYPDILNSNSSFINHKLPSFYEPMINGNQKVTLLLDEVDKANNDLQAPLLELTQSKTINGRHLPNLSSIIATGNLISEGGSRPSVPLLDRMEKYIVEADAKFWLEWAGTANIHPTCTAYVNDHHSHLYGDVDPGDRYADESPRGWENVSKMIYMAETMNLDKSITLDKVSGILGKKVGLNYNAYFEYYQNLIPLVNNLFDGKSVTKEFNALQHTEQTVFAMIVGERFASLCDKLNIESVDFKNFTKIFSNFFKEVSPELTMIVIRSQLSMSRIDSCRLLHDTNFKQLMEVVHNYGK